MKEHPEYDNIRRAETVEDALEIALEHEDLFIREYAEMASAIRVLAEKVLENENDRET